MKILSDTMFYQPERLTYEDSIGLSLSNIIVEDQYVDDCFLVGVHVGGTIVNKMEINKGKK